MSGLDKMTQQILQEAQAQADAVIAEARKNADEAVRQAKQGCEVWKKEAGNALEQELKEFRVRAASARDLNRRREILAAKQTMIAEMIEKTCDRMRHAEEKEYFDTLRRIFEKFGHGEEGQMYLSAKDLERMPKKFAEEIQDIAVKKGGSIEIMKTPGSISDGFLLVYGGVEENCTFEALIEADRSRLQDQVNAMLWREANG